VCVSVRDVRVRERVCVSECERYESERYESERECVCV
jgi:hypothetical protein